MQTMQTGFCSQFIIHLILEYLQATSLLDLGVSSARFVSDLYIYLKTSTKERYFFVKINYSQRYHFFETLYPQTSPAPLWLPCDITSRLFPAVLVPQLTLWVLRDITSRLFAAQLIQQPTREQTWHF